MKYPLSYYNVTVNNYISVLVSDDTARPSEDDGRIYLELSDTTLPEVTLDGSFNLAITACNDISCRTSNSIKLSKHNFSQNHVSEYTDYMGTRLLWLC